MPFFVLQFLTGLEPTPFCGSNLWAAILGANVQLVTQALWESTPYVKVSSQKRPTRAEFCVLLAASRCLLLPRTLVPPYNLIQDVKPRLHRFGDCSLTLPAL